VTLEYVNVNKSDFPSNTRLLVEAPQWAWLHTRHFCLFTAGTCSDVIIVLFHASIM